MNQFGAELILKCRDLLANGGVANPTFLPASGEAPLFNQPNERLHRIEFIHTRLRIPLQNRFYAKSGDSLLFVHFKNAAKKASCPPAMRSEEHTSELQSRFGISY